MSKLGLFIFCKLAKIFSQLNKKRIINHRIKFDGTAQKYIKWRKDTYLYNIIVLEKLPD